MHTHKNIKRVTIHQNSIQFLKEPHPQEHLPTIKKSKNPLNFSPSPKPRSALTDPSKSPTSASPKQQKHIKKDGCPSICTLFLEEKHLKTNKKEKKQNKFSNTSRKIALNSKWLSLDTPKSSRYDRLERVKGTNFETIDLHQFLSPKIKNSQVLKNNPQLMNKYFQNFKRASQNEEETINFLSIRHLDKLTDISHFQHMQRLKITLKNKKLEQTERKLANFKLKFNTKKNTKNKLNQPMFNGKPCSSQVETEINCEPWEQDLVPEEQLNL